MFLDDMDSKSLSKRAQSLSVHARYCQGKHGGSLPRMSGPTPSRTDRGEMIAHQQRVHLVPLPDSRVGPGEDNSEPMAKATNVGMHKISLGGAAPLAFNSPFTSLHPGLSKEQFL